MKSANQLMNIGQSFESDVRPELDRRVQLVVSSIVGGFLAGDNPETTSFRHIINRIMVLVQMPMCFVLLEKQDGKFNVTCNFNNHPRDAGDIDKCIRAITDGSELFRLFGTAFYLLAIVVDKKNGHHDFHTLKNFKHNTPTTTEQLAAYQLREVVDEHKYENLKCHLAANQTTA